MELKIGEKIRGKRKEKGLTLKELAGDMVTASQISAVEKGKCNPSQTLLEYISQRLQVDIEYFILSDEERCRNRFEKIKGKCDGFIKNKQYKEVIEILNDFNGCINLLSDAQKGYYYSIHGNCMFEEQQYSKAFENYINSLSYYLKTKDIYSTMHIHIKIGDCLYNSQKYTLALGYYFNVYNWNSNHYDMKMHAMSRMAFSYIYLDKYDSANNIINKLLEFMNNKEAIDKDIYIPDIYIMEGIINRKIKKHKESIQKFNDAYDMYLKINNKAGMNRAKNNIGVVFWEMGEIDKAIESFNCAIKLQNNDNSNIDAYINLSKLYNQMGNLKKSFEIIDMAEEKVLLLNYVPDIIKIFVQKLDCLILMNEFDRAEIFAFLALDYIQKSYDFKAEYNLYIKMSSMYKRMDDEKTFLDYLIKSQEMKL